VAGFVSCVTTSYQVTRLRLRYDVLTAVTKKIAVLWDVTPCSLVYKRVSFEAVYIFYTITLRNFVVPTFSVWYTESHIVLIISFLLVVLFTQFIVDKIKKSRAVSS